MDKLKLRIEKFNSTIKEKLEEFQYNFYHLKFSEPVSENEINEVQDFFEIPIPEELKILYKELGSIKNEAGESYAVEIEPVPYLLEKLKEENKWYKCHSLGLIDYIKFSWVNDRPEFNGVEQSKIEHLNNHYKCFGLYRFNWGLEEAYYLYFDKNQKFGWVRYHQDCFDDLWAEHLDGMLESSPANKNFEDLMISVVDQLEVGILQNG
jgi:hypothetical protein